MKSLCILIVEDEILIAETIRLYLEEAGHRVCAACISYEQALAAFILHEPDLVLLDIRLFGEKSGIDVAQYLQTADPPTPYIFLTSQHDKRILDLALKTVPYGYITKPLQKQTLWTSIEAAYKLFLFHHNRREKLEISDGKENYKINLDDILYIEADHVYTHIFLMNDRKLIVRKGLQQIQDLLNMYIFIRCHRSFIINAKMVERWNKDMLLLKNGVNIPVSKTYKDSVLHQLQSDR